MLYILCFLLSIAVLTVTVGIAVFWAIRGRRGRFTPFHLILIGAFLADLFLMFPLSLKASGQDNSLWQAFWMAVHNTMQIFTINGDLSFVKDMVADQTEVNQIVFVGYAYLMYVISPILTAGFVLSFFRNLSSYVRYFLRLGNVYVFSEMDKRAWALAKDIVREDRHATIVIAGRDGSEWDEEARHIGAIYFSKDVTELDLRFRLGRGELSFFLMREDFSANISDAMSVIPHYRGQARTNIYVFSPLKEHEILLSAVDSGACTVRVINTVTSFVYRFLYEEGEEILESASVIEDGIHEVAVGLVGIGQYGSEIAKALPWFCQLEGFRLTLHVFEPDQRRIDAFCSSCPGLVGEEFNGRFDEKGLPQYRITFHNCTTDSPLFCEMLSGKDAFTYFFVLTGNDDTNLRISLKIRELCGEYQTPPIIRTRLYNSEMASLAENIGNFKHQPYDIRLFARLEDAYSYRSLIFSEWLTEALLTHLQWGSVDSFWRYEDNRTDHVSGVIFLKTLLSVGEIPCVDSFGALNTDQFDKLCVCDHRRWCAGMLAHGYVYAKKRNDIAKRHRGLVAYEELPDAVKRHLNYPDIVLARLSEDVRNRHRMKRNDDI